MSLITETHRTLSTPKVDDYILTWVEAFLIDRKARGVAGGTPTFYSQKLKQFTGFCEGQALTYISQISPTFIREYLLNLEQTGHNPGGRHAAFFFFARLSVMV